MISRIFLISMFLLLTGITDLQYSYAQTCTLVELNPGYPGYRGMVTGLKGVGDHECLEVLEENDAEFDRDAEDIRNRSAARSLGIRGSFSDWTWENWMAIEVERGLQASCYACLLLDANAVPDSRGADVPPEDPRLILGMLSGDSLERWVLETTSQSYLPNSHEGIVWRVQAALLYPDETLNAAETLEAAAWLIKQYRTPGGRYLRLDAAWSVFQDRGGYVEMTGDESERDQVYQAAAVVHMVANTSVQPSGVIQQYYSALDSCALDTEGFATVGHCVGEKISWFD